MTEQHGIKGMIIFIGLIYSFISLIVSVILYFLVPTFIIDWDFFTIHNVVNIGILIYSVVYFTRLAIEN